MFDTKIILKWLGPANHKQLWQTEMSTPWVVVTHSLIPAQAGRGRSEVQAARVMRSCLKEVGAAALGKKEGIENIYEHLTWQKGTSYSGEETTFQWLVRY